MAVMATDDVPADLFSAVVEALEAARDEFDQLTDPDFDVAGAMLPESVEKMAREHTALLAVMKRLAEGSAEKRAKLATMYRQELDNAFPDPIELGRVPVSDEVMRQMADALELVRRRACVDGHVRDALAA
jgi:hypothetical protein